LILPTPLQLRHDFLHVISVKKTARALISIIFMESELASVELSFMFFHKKL
jgi:hypothetical protein